MIYDSYRTKDNKIVDKSIVIDWEIVNEICSFDKNTYNSILVIFFKEFDIYIKNINNKNCIEELHLIAHAIKGSSATIGFNELSCCSNWYMVNNNIDNIKFTNYRKNFITALTQSKQNIQKEIKQNINIKMF
jgi:HPt (histidine-containing phosphotransfer) domain-containing protein